MRTTIDLPEDLHSVAVAIARDRGQTLSQTVADLLRRGLGTQTRPGSAGTDDATGLPVVQIGRLITTEDVRALDDES